MTHTYTQLTGIKNRILKDLEAQQNSIENTKNQFTVIEATLGNMQTTYTGWAGEVNTLAAANPNDAAIQALKAERDLLMAEFQSTKDEAAALKDAVNGV